MEQITCIIFALDPLDDEMAGNSFDIRSTLCVASRRVWAGEMGFLARGMRRKFSRNSCERTASSSLASNTASSLRKFLSLITVKFSGKLRVDKFRILRREKKEEFLADREHGFKLLSSLFHTETRSEASQFFFLTNFTILR